MKTYNWLNRNRPLSRLRFATVGAFDLITKNVSIRELINRSPQRRGFVLIPLLLVCFGLSPAPNAFGLLPPPPPDGGYPGYNTAEGTNALFNLTTGSSNTAVGWFSLKTTTTGSFNTAVGAGTLNLNTGNRNTAIGAAALFLNNSGVENTGNGTLALFHNVSGGGNTAIGDSALFSNTSGNQNTANGWQALLHNTTGTQNTANGSEALKNNTTGNSNTANGSGALLANTTSFGNTASGFVALFANTTGSGNMANGAGALQGNITGDGNVASGFQALEFNTSGSSNTALGYQAGINQTIGTNNVYIGAGIAGVAGENNTCYIANIFTGAGVNGIPVYIDPFNKLGVVPSSKRFKEHIKPIGKASEGLFALKPVTFRYKSDAKRTSQFGLIAEEVAKVNSDLVVRDNDGEIYSVRYDQVNAMLLNEFLKEHAKVEEQNHRIQEQEATVAQLKSAMIKQQKGMELLAANLKEQDSKIEKVSAHWNLSKPSPQTVLNNQ